MASSGNGDPSRFRYVFLSFLGGIFIFFLLAFSLLTFLEHEKWRENVEISVQGHG